MAEVVLTLAALLPDGDVGGKSTRKLAARDIAEARRAPLPQKIQPLDSGNADITPSDQN